MNIPMTVATSVETIQVATGSNAVSLPVTLTTTHQIPVNVAVNSQLLEEESELQMDRHMETYNVRYLKNVTI